MRHSAFSITTLYWVPLCRMLLCWVSRFICSQAECHYADCRDTQWRYADFHSDECRYAECRYAECHYAEGRYSEGRYAEGHYRECPQAECRYAECRCVKCRGASDCCSHFANKLFRFSSTFLFFNCVLMINKLFSWIFKNGFSLHLVKTSSLTQQ